MKVEEPSEQQSNKEPGRQKGRYAVKHGEHSHCGHHDQQDMTVRNTEGTVDFDASIREDHTIN